MIDLYRLLGIKRGATKAEVRRAYRRKAKVSHPDSGGSVEAFSALATAHEVLADKKRREKYDTTGEIEPARPDNFDGSALEVIAPKLGLIIHAEQELTAMDIGAVIEQAIREDIICRQASILSQGRAMERAGRLRARVKRKANGEDNALALVLDWHERAAKDNVKKNEEAVRALERALEILDGYAFIEEFPSEAADQVSVALHDAIQSLEELAAILNARKGARAQLMA